MTDIDSEYIYYSGSDRQYFNLSDHTIEYVYFPSSLSKFPNNYTHMENEDNEHKNKHSQAYRKQAVVDYNLVDTITYNRQ